MLPLGGVMESDVDRVTPREATGIPLDPDAIVERLEKSRDPTSDDRTIVDDRYDQRLGDGVQHET